MNRRTGLLLFALAGCLPMSLGFAEPPNHLMDKPLERAGRLFGVCWGDGYHACASSGKRLLADLPPQSNLVRPVMHYKSVVPGHGHRHGPTFYDRFDALNQSLFHTSHCCVPGCEIVDCDGRCNRGGCDNTACDSPGCDGSCDGGGYAAEHGVMMVPGNHPMSMPVRDPSAAVDLPSFSGPPQPEFAAPTQNDASVEESERLPEPTRAPSLKPTKPADEASKEASGALFDPQPILTAPRAAADSPWQIPVADQPFETSPVSPLTNTFRDQPDSLARRSPTPSDIAAELPTEIESPVLGSARLEMPTFAGSTKRPARLGQMSKPKDQTAALEDKVAEPLDLATRPLIQVNELFSPVIEQSGPVVELSSPGIELSSPAIEQSSPRIEPPSMAAPATMVAKPRRLGQSQAGLIAADSTTADSNTTDSNRFAEQTVSQSSEPAVAPPTVARPDRPTRLGASSATPRTNPFDARPVVEMAKRASESDQGVVRQPSQLK